MPDASTTQDMRPHFEDIQAHYDLSDEFFGLFQDETRKYSCAFFTGPDVTLSEAQIATVDQLLELLRGDEVVVDAVHFTRTPVPGGCRHAEVQVGHLLAQATDDCRLPYPGRPGQHHHSATAAVVGRHARAVRPSAGIHS